MRRLLALLVALWLGTAHAATLTTPTGTLASSQTATGISANAMAVDGRRVVYVEYIISGTATVVMEQQLKGGTNFQVVSGSSQTSSTILKIDLPAGIYQSNVTACTACTVTVKYQAIQVQ